MKYIYIYNIKNNSMMVYKDTNPYIPQENEYYITEKQFNDLESNRDKVITATLNDDSTLTFEFVEIPLTEEQILNQLRVKRKPLLEAFDLWEKAVLRGREEDDASIMLWYYDLLNLVESAFENIPDRIKYYLGGNNQ